MIFSAEEIHMAATQCRPILNKILSEKVGEIADILKSRDEVLNRYQPIFSKNNIVSLTKEDYLSFLIYSNNKHWRSLQRMGPAQTENMNVLRDALTILLDETKPLKERLDILLPTSGAMIPRFGPATFTPILMIAYPEKYGVLNNPTEAALRKLYLWPKFEKKVVFSHKYIEVNEIINALARELGIDLWTLDALWWAILLKTEVNDVEDIDQEEKEESELEVIGLSDAPRFGLERYLQEFLRDNWDRIPELKGWNLYEENGDVVGFEYNTGEIGRIDLLAFNRQSHKWLVIELKREQSSDQTVGQVLRYMGWVKKNLAEGNDEVFGMIICRTSDPNLSYALENMRNISLLLYEVNFRLTAQ